MFVYPHNLSFIVYDDTFGPVNTRLEDFFGIQRRFSVDSFALSNEIPKDRGITTDRESRGCLSQNLDRFFYYYHNPHPPTVDQSFELPQVIFSEPLVTLMEAEGAGNFVDRIRNLILTVGSNPVLQPNINYHLLIIFHPLFDDDEDFIRMSMMTITFHKFAGDEPFLYFFSTAQEMVVVDITYRSRATYRRVII